MNYSCCWIFWGWEFQSYKNTTNWKPSTMISKKNNHPLQPRKPTMRNLCWTPETPLQTMGGSSRLFSQTTGYSTPKGQVSHQKCTEENFQDHQQECNYQVVLKSSSPCSANTKVFFFRKTKSAACLKKAQNKRGNMSFFQEITGVIFIYHHGNLRYPPPKLPPPRNKALLRDY